jgi:hypothetical protein
MHAMFAVSSDQSPDDADNIAEFAEVCSALVFWSWNDRCRR